MDEAPVYFDMVPGKTIHMKGAKTINNWESSTYLID